MDDHYLIEWRHRNPDAMLFNYWHKHGVFDAGRISEKLTEEQVRREMPSLVANDQIELKVTRVTHDYVAAERFL